jgi:hypothetical protein
MWGVLVFSKFYLFIIIVWCEESFVTICYNSTKLGFFVTPNLFKEKNLVTK